MISGCPAHNANAETGVLRPDTVVDILEIHKIPLVEESDPVNSRSSDQHRGAGHGVDVDDRDTVGCRDRYKIGPESTSPQSKSRGPDSVRLASKENYGCKNPEIRLALGD